MIDDRRFVEALLAALPVDDAQRAVAIEFMDAGGDPKAVLLGMRVVLKAWRRATEASLAVGIGGKKITLQGYLEAMQVHRGHRERVAEALDVSVQGLTKFEQTHPELALLSPGVDDFLRRLVRSQLKD